MLKTSKTSHVKTKAHKEAVKALNTLSQNTPSVAVPPTQNARYVTMNTWHTFFDNDSHSVNPYSSPEDPFNDITMNEDIGTYFDGVGNPIQLSAGLDPLASATRLKTHLNAEMDGLELLRTHGLFTSDSDLVEEPDDTIEESFLSLTIEEAGAMHPDAEDIVDEMEGINNEVTASDSAWKPHASKTVNVMLDLLDNLPRLRLSDDHLKAIIWAMQECGTPNVPTFSELRKVQSSLTREFELTSRHHQSAMENHFYMNHPASLLALDWANPLVRKHIHVYPEVSPVVSETFHAAKWLEEVDLDELSPMWADWDSPLERHRHFYVKELAKTAQGVYIMPLRWITIKNVVYADAYSVHFSPISRLFEVQTGKLCQVRALDLKSNVLDIQAQLPNDIHFHGEPFPLINPLRKQAQGRPMFRLRVIPWSDDVSGNVSKQYNAHTNIYITNANLPHAKLSQEFFMRFCSTSSHASSTEQFVALLQDFNENIWHHAFDCELEEPILFQIIPHFLPADNPQQSETSSHIGVNGNRNCRRDLTGGTDAEKESNIGYEALYHPGEPRDSEQALQTIRYIIWLACHGNTDAVQSTMSASGIKDKIAQYWIDQLLLRSKLLRQERIKNEDTRDQRLNSKSLKGARRKALKDEIVEDIARECWDWVLKQPARTYEKLATDDRDHYNMLLTTRGVSPNQDTPVETLHTWLLGNKKYVWHSTNESWSKDQDEIFAIRLQSACLDGLTLPPPRAAYLIKYKNSLIGKHFKILQQLGIFKVHDLCPPSIFNLWKASGELGAMIWFTEIDNMDMYLHDLQILIDNLLDAWAKVDPRRILTKIKLHALVHLPEDIRRFGPSMIFATEIFECFNAVFRTCSVLSNHLAPSRDIAESMSGMERFKHMVSGGYWKDEKTGRFIQGGIKTRNFLKNNPELQRRLGWAPEHKIARLNVHLANQRIHLTSTINVDPECIPTNLPDTQPDIPWDHCRTLISQSTDTCHPGSWIFFKQAVGFHCRIIKLLIPSSTDELSSEGALAIVEHFRILDTKDPIFDMPVLDVLFDFNAQHDCVSGTCPIIETNQQVVQERLQTAMRQKGILHRDNQRYLLNTHALHNAHLI
ncbi:hypothetical protein K435DRAFT_819604 [Dendrothele bispora CBS 962.96]|uniref:Uncharacterized protein n=1 Tax=Dendrothele bispora (strain CBS 962.96) TaxID=1314807 RepID=A0A4S8M2C8_DENBC|nr:hypothetical protein K435DRAFT_819604 [Dendrothele bispora CBS 962.96]